MFTYLIDLLKLIASQASRIITVDDLPATEMSGMQFKMALPDTAQNLTVGMEVIVSDWNDREEKADCFILSTGTVLTIEKFLLTTKDNSIAELRKYRTGLDHQRGLIIKSLEKIEQQKQKISEWEAREQEYEDANNHDLWVTEINNRNGYLFELEVILENRKKHMNRRLMRETMYNRFDADIKQWTSHYNNTLSPAQALDPNIVKSMIFEESHMGTTGRQKYLLPPPYNNVEESIQSRFNIGQAIDSGGQIFFIMIKEMSPSIFSQFGLDALETNSQWKSMKNTEFDTWNNGNFIKAITSFLTFKNTTNNTNLMGNSGKELHTDYAFWIRTAIRWLFLKYDSFNSSWPSAIKAYNSFSTKGENYKRRVLSRVGSLQDLHVGDK